MHPLKHSSVEPKTLEENKMTIHSFLNQSYDQAKKQLGQGVSRINEGVSFLKDGIFSFCDKTGDYFQKMLSPVNNFLKDHSQIETELKQEQFQNKDEFQISSCTIIPIEVALLSPMEENY